MRRIVGGVPGQKVAARTMPIAGLVLPIRVDGLTPGETYSWSVHVSRDGVNSEFSSPDSAPVTMPTVAVHLFTDSSARGVAGVDVQVFALPENGSQWITGERLFASTDLAFDAQTQGGRARLVIPFPSGSPGLPAGQHVCAVARKKLGGGMEIWTRIVSDAIVVQ